VILEKIKKNLDTENLPHLLIVFIFSLILVIPPFLRGGKEVIATFTLFVFLLPLTYLIWRLKGKFELARVKAPFIFLAIFILGMGVSIFYSPEKYLALETFLHFLAYFLLFFLIFNFIDSQKLIRYFAYLTLFLGTILSVWGIYNFILSESFGSLRLISTFGWHIPFGEFLMYPLFLSLGFLFLKPPNLSSKILLVPVLSLFFITFYLNHTRGAWLSFIVISFFLFLFFRKNIFRKEVVISATLIILLSLTGIYGLQQIKANQAAKLSQEASFTGAETLQENAITARLHFWKVAFEIFKDKPLSGGGLASYQSLHKQYLKPPFYYSSDPHNFYLKVLAETGIVFFFVFLGVAASLFYYSFQILKKIRSRLKTETQFRKSDAFLVGMIGGTTAALFHNLINVGWFFPANFIIFFLFAGIILKMHTLEYPVKPEGERRQKNPTLGFIKTSFIFFIAFILFCAGFLLLISDFYHEKGRGLLQEGEREEAIHNFQKALQFNSINPEYNRSLAGAYFLLARVNEGNGSGLLEKALSLSKKTMGWTNNSEDFNFQGKIFVFQEELDLAKEKFWSAAEQNPQNFDAYLELAQLYANQNNSEKVHAVVEDTVISQFRKEYVLSPLYAAPDKNLILLKFSILHNRNGEAYLKEENFEKAETEFQKATSYYPQNEFAWKNLLFLKLRDGNMSAAKSYLQEAWKNNPNSTILPDIESLP
jgi:O-antigen ligase/Tfp pilus assembly protein PilF